jgi:hypothetical protein
MFYGRRVAGSSETGSVIAKSTFAGITQQQSSDSCIEFLRLLLLESCM